MWYQAKSFLKVKTDHINRFPRSHNMKQLCKTSLARHNAMLVGTYPKSGFFQPTGFLSPSNVTFLCGHDFADDGDDCMVFLSMSVETTKSCQGKVTNFTSVKQQIKVPCLIYQEMKITERTGTTENTTIKTSSDLLSNYLSDRQQRILFNGKLCI